MGRREAILGEDAAGGVVGGLLVTGEATAGVGEPAEWRTLRRESWSNGSPDIESR